MSTKNPTKRSAVKVVYESEPLEQADVEAAAAVRLAAYSREPLASGIVVVDGGGLRIHVERGALTIEDGAGGHRRARRFEKATHGLSRVVVLGSTGIVSLDALTWCRRLGIGVVVLSADGTATLASTPRMTDDARLRRMQARAVDLPVGLDLARSLIVGKLQGQSELLAGRFDDHDAACTILELSGACDGAAGFDDLRQLEASAAALYFQSWVGRPDCVPTFAAKDRSRVPPHWGRYEGRRSVLQSGNGNRKAERPANALLNYLYALLEVEAILACNVVGLDPGLGLIHSDLKGRASLALDLIEPIRPQVDRHVLDLMERRTFRKAEFIETPDGHCRLQPPLTHELAETLPQWAKAMAPIAEEVAHSLGKAMSGKYLAATPLSQKNAMAAQAVVKARKAAAKGTMKSAGKRQKPSHSMAEPWACPDCGSPVTNSARVRCDACVDADPRHSEERRGKRGAAIAARKKAIREWDEANPGVGYEPDYFRREILPGLADVKLTEIMEAAGISKGFASVVRRGVNQPHVSTWRALEALARQGAGECVAWPK